MAETKGFVGERYDADAGLQYLNARYYDPQLALFLQPDWFEVTKAGVGTNRYAYSLNDPVNASDPGGNSVEWFEPDFRFNYQTGTDAHQTLAGYVDENTEFIPEKPIFTGSEPIWPGIESFFRGRPDASRKTSPNTTEFFDWKPVTHRNSPDLKRKDRLQQNKWRSEARSKGKDLVPIDTTKIIEDGKVVGIIMSLPKNGIMREYEVVTYSSRELGIAYYDLRETGRYRETFGSKALRAFTHSIKDPGRRNKSISVILPLPSALLLLFP